MAVDLHGRIFGTYKARAEHTKPTQLIRRWSEERHTGEPSLELRVRRLEDLVQRGAERDT